MNLFDLFRRKPEPRGSFDAYAAQAKATAELRAKLLASKRFTAQPIELDDATEDAMLITGISQAD